MSNYPSIMCGRHCWIVLFPGGPNIRHNISGDSIRIWCPVRCGNDDAHRFREMKSLVGEVSHYYRKWFVSIGSSIPTAAVVRYLFNCYGRGSTEMSSRALVMTGTKHCVLGDIMRRHDTPISWVLSDSVLSVVCSGSGAWVILIGVMILVRLSSSGSVQNAISLTRPYLG